MLCLHEHYCVFKQQTGETALLSFILLFVGARFLHRGLYISNVRRGAEQQIGSCSVTFGFVLGAILYQDVD